MTSFVRALSVGLGSAILVILVMWIGLSQLGPSQSPAPTDEKLAANFRAHKQALESLVEMTKVDRNRIVRLPEGQRFSTREQDRKFNDLVREAGVQGDMHESRPDGVNTTYLICWSRGLMTNGTLKGYAYSETELTPLVQSLDEDQPLPKGSKVIFKKLEGNWYLFLMST